MAKATIKYSVQRTGNELTDRNLDLIKRSLDSLTGGITGPAGPAGTSGPAGATGATGASGASGSTVLGQANDHTLFLRADGTWADPTEDLLRKFRLLLKAYVLLLEDWPAGLEDDEVPVALDTE